MANDIEIQDSSLVYLGAIAVVLVFIIGTLVFLFFFRDAAPAEDPSSQVFEYEQNEFQPAEFPESEVVVEAEPPAPDAEPELPANAVVDELGIVYLPAETPAETVEPIPEFTTYTPPPTTYDEFIESGLIWEDAPYEEPLIITPFSMAAEPAPFIDPLAPVGAIDDNNLKDCGTIRVSTSNPNPSASSIISLLKRNSGVECMGEAIGDDCEAATASVQMTGGGGEIYVADRADGSCGIGISTTPGSVYLCSMKELMDYASSDTKTEAQWIDEFDSDPDGTMAAMVANIAGISATLGTSFNCEIYSI